MMRSFTLLAFLVVSLPLQAESTPLQNPLQALGSGSTSKIVVLRTTFLALKTLAILQVEKKNPPPNIPSVKSPQKKAFMLLI